MGDAGVPHSPLPPFGNVTAAQGSFCGYILNPFPKGGRGFKGDRLSPYRSITVPSVPWPLPEVGMSGF